jgi:hypothetical protein
MTTKNQNYIELPVQDAVGTPEAGFVSLGFANGKFQGRDVDGNPIFFYPPGYSYTVGDGFDAGEWSESGGGWEFCVYTWAKLFDHARNLTVQVRDAAGDLVLGGVNIDEDDGTITLFSSAPYAGTAYITGVITIG